MKTVKPIQPKIVIFTAVKNGGILHGRVFVMLALNTTATILFTGSISTLPEVLRVYDISKLF